MKPQPIDDAALDKFLADLNSEWDMNTAKAQAEYQRMNAVPVPRLHLLKAVIGGLLFAGSVLFLIYWLYPVYEKLLGGIQ